MSELSDMGYEPTESECPHCEDGSLWVNTFELVCDNCCSVVRKGGEHTRRRSPNEDFRSSRDERTTYDVSERVVLPGGFFQAYRGEGIYGDGE